MRPPSLKAEAQVARPTSLLSSSRPTLCKEAPFSIAGQTETVSISHPLSVRCKQRLKTLVLHRQTHLPRGWGIVRSLPHDSYPLCLGESSAQMQIPISHLTTRGSFSRYLVLIAVALS